MLRPIDAGSNTVLTLLVQLSEAHMSTWNADQSKQEMDRRRRYRRAGKVGGRRRHDRGLPWWRGGLSFAALCLLLRYWRVIRQKPSGLLSGTQ
jgi:hypothetical protein